MALVLLGLKPPILLIVPRSLTISQLLFVPEILVDFSLSPLTDLHLFKLLFKTTWRKGTDFKSGKKYDVFPV